MPKTEMIKYTQDGLVITIPCAEPAAIHAQLLRSITANIQYSSCSTDKSTFYMDEVVPIINLLKVIMPDERHLLQAYS